MSVYKHFITFSVQSLIFCCVKAAKIPSLKLILNSLFFFFSFSLDMQLSFDPSYPQTGMPALLEAVWFSPMLPAAVPQAVKQPNFLQAAINTVNKGQVKTSASFL